jgi:hypothetical protein
MKKLFNLSRIGLLIGFSTWVCSNLVFSLIYGINTEPNSTEKSLDWFFNEVVGWSFLLMLFTFFNKMYNIMDQDETENKV